MCIAQYILSIANESRYPLILLLVAVLTATVGLSIIASLVDYITLHNHRKCE